MSTIVRNRITLCKFEQLTPVVGIYLDHAGGWRLHTEAEKAGYRGYALPEFDYWNVRAWCPVSGFEFKRRYLTERGAIAGLSRVALKVEG